MKIPLAPAYGGDPVEAESTRLMLAAKHGDGAAFDLLVLQLRARACRVAESLVGSREEALDLSQEAFLKVYRARGTFPHGEPFLPWFHRILRNTCFSHLRRAGRLRPSSARPDGEGGEREWEIEDPIEPPSAGLERAELAGAFRRALATLPARDREILVLRHFQECSYRQIARILAIPEGTVMSRLFHARRRLREQLGPLLGEAAAGVEEKSGGGPG